MREPSGTSAPSLPGPCEPSGAPAAAGHFTASDGADLYFVDSGGDGPVLFFIYGLACSIAHWKYALEFFGSPAAGAGGDFVPGIPGPTRRHRRIWMDFRGHGRSPPPRPGERLTIANLVSDIQELCRNRGIERATFLGQSMGGSVALALAAAAPELVHGLVLLTSPGRDPGPGFAMQPVSGLAWRLLLALNRRTPRLMRRTGRLLKPHLHNPAFIAVLVEIIRTGGFNVTLSQTADIREYVDALLDVDLHLFLDLADELARFDVARLGQTIACPTLIIAGAADRVIPLAESERLATFLPRSELLVVPHGSHCPHFDDPNLVNRRLDEFLEHHAL